MTIYQKKEITTSSGRLRSINIQIGPDTISFVMQLINEILELDIENVIELGAENGDLLQALFKSASQKDGYVDSTKYIGVEQKQDGCETANAKQPTLTWIQSDVYRFLVESDNLKIVTDCKYSLIIIRPESSIMENPEKFRESIRIITSLLKLDGIILFIWPKKQYFEWLYSRVPPWPVDPIDIIKEKIGEPRIYKNKKYLIYVYGGDIANKLTDTLSISTMFKHKINTLVYYEYGQQIYSAYIANSESEHLILSEYTKPIWHLVRENWLQERGAYERAKPIIQLERNNNHGYQSRLNILVPNCRLYIEEKSISLTNKIFIEAEKYSFNLIYFPVTLVNLRKATTNFSFMLAHDSDVIVLGMSANDHCIDTISKQSLIDIDEFERRLEWCCTEAVNRNKSICYVLPVEINTTLEDGYQLNPTVIKQFRNCIIELMTTYNMHYMDIPYESFSSKKNVINSILDQLSKLKKKNHIPPDDAINCDTKYQLSDKIEIHYEDGDVQEVTGRTAENMDISTAIVSMRVSADDDRPYFDGKALQNLGGRTQVERGLQKMMIDWLISHYRQNLPSTMLIGDSIRMRISNATGYGIHAYKQLIGKANLIHIPHNCGGTNSVFYFLDNWLDAKPEIVFFNAGLHDLAHHTNKDVEYAAYNTPQQYHDNLCRIFDKILDSGVKKLIWGLNTPVEEDWHTTSPYTGEQRQLYRYNEDVVTYNQISIEAAQEYNLDIIDLFAPLWEKGASNVLLADGVHLNHIGASLLGGIVADAVLSAIEVRTDNKII